MCGIAGFNFKDDELAKKMTGAIARRGPDDEGIFSDGRLTIGNRRLAIIDLSSAGHQPMFNREKTIGIVYNGEIYNFRELRDELRARGFVFESDTDTEVILKGYEAYGEKIIERLRGMWAIAIYDAPKGRLFLSRDFFGIKPLYYFFDGKVVVFASEIKAIKKFLEKNKTKLHFSPLAVSVYFVLGYTPHPLTIFEEIKKVSPGETVIFDLAANNFSSSFLKWEEGGGVSRAADFEKVMLESVEKHLISDVPVGVFLSGGADSTLIALLLKKLGKKLNAFTVRIKERKDADYAGKIAAFSGLNQREISLDENNFEEMYQKTWEMLDEPIADNSLFPSLLISREAAKSVKVVMTGEGGDELFLGYERYQKMKGLYFPGAGLLRRPESVLYLRYLRPLFRRLRSGNLLSFYLENAAIDSDFADRLAVKKHLAERFSNDKQLINLFDEKLYLPNDLLYKTDFATMSYSIEGRVPILDKEVYAYARNLPMEEKLSGGIGKKIIKDYLAKNLPPELIFRQKEGFSLPLREYLFKNHEAEIKEALRYLLENKINSLSRPACARALKDQSYFALLKDKFPAVLFAALAFYKVTKKYDVEGAGSESVSI